MQFCTHTDIRAIDKKINYQTGILMLGSCFSEHIAKRLQYYHFPVTANPTGILFNPLSIARTLSMFQSGAIPKIDLSGERYFSYDVHSSLSCGDLESFTKTLEDRIELGSRALAKSEFCIFTFGTAFAYKLQNGKVVANCHKQPGNLFTKTLLEAEEIADEFIELLDGILRNKEVIFTISPVRHLADGLEENSLSKSILRVGVDLICRRHKNAHYFPSYEIFMDELRDYRFYDTDMIHPGAQGIEYVWERFMEYAVENDAHQLMEQVQKIMQAAGHRPLHPKSHEHAAFCTEQLKKIDSLKGKVDLSKEREIFLEYTKI